MVKRTYDQQMVFLPASNAPNFKKLGTLVEERAMIRGNLNCCLAVLPMSSRATSSSLLPIVLCTSVGDRRTSGLVNAYTSIEDYH